DPADPSHRHQDGTHPAPPPPGWPSAHHNVCEALPFHLAERIADGHSTREQAGLEAALEAGGLLPAWLRADGHLYDPSTRDLVLSPARQAKGRTLLDVLVPLPSPGQGVSAETVRSLLASVSLHSTGQGAEDNEAKHRRDESVATVS